jgi:glutathione synthase/RimK-type ligase-like ATP-grasp enzyme
MGPRLLVMGAGTGASNNLIRSLRSGNDQFVIVGCHPDRFTIRKSPADSNYVVPDSSHPDLYRALSDIIEADEIDLLIPTSDTDVQTIVPFQDALPCRTFLPRPPIVELCQDKYELTTLLRACGVPAPRTYPISDLSMIEDLFGRLAPHSRLWCRIRTGNSSAGALPVETPEQARSWIRYWNDMRGVATDLFTLSEYLPGRDFNLQCLLREGTPVLIKMCERLSYFVTGNSPSGVSSTPAVARTVEDRRVIDTCLRAFRAIGEQPSGIFNVDLKEDVDGVPCITEINAGRFAMITNIYDLTGHHNMAITYVHLALGDPVDVPEANDVVDDYYLVRDLDTTPGIFHADQLFDGIRDGRKPGLSPRSSRTTV